MSTNILVPLDGSPLAEGALPFARQLALQSGGTLHLVRVTTMPQGVFWSPAPTYMADDTIDELRVAADREAARYLDEVRRSPALRGVSMVGHQLDGPPGQRLEEFIKDQRIDLTVMVSHGRGGLSRLALGSVAGHLLHHSAAPLLLVHTAAEPPALRHILIPLDGSRRAEGALDAVMSGDRRAMQDLTLLRVIGFEEEREEAEDYLRRVCEFLAVARTRVESLVMLGSPAQSIIDIAGTAHLIVMVTHGRTGLTRWALGSVGDQVAREAQAPVLLLREGALHADHVGHQPPFRALA